MIRIEQYEFIEFPIDRHGRYIIKLQELKFWNKAAFKKLVNDIVTDWKITFEEKCLLLQEIEVQLIHDFTQYKEMYERYGIKNIRELPKDV